MQSRAFQSGKNRPVLLSILKKRTELFGLPSHPNTWIEGHWIKLYGFKQSKWIFHHTDQVELWNSLPQDLSNDTNVHRLKGRKHKLMEEKSFEGYWIRINHIQLMQPDSWSWMWDWKSTRKHPVCHVMGGCLSRYPFTATAGNWILG